MCHACASTYFQPVCRCHQCGIRMDQANTTSTTKLRCGQCLKQQPAYDATIVLADYVAPINQLVMAMKHAQGLSLAPWLAAQLADALQVHGRHDQDICRPDVALPVPLTQIKLAQRGFNQAWEITRPLTQKLNLHTSARQLQKIRDTLDQHTLPLRERSKNMHQAFAWSTTAGTTKTIQGSHIAIVDDVMTSGATLNEIAQLLKRHGASKVTNLVVCRTPAPETKLGANPHPSLTG